MRTFINTITTKFNPRTVSICVLSLASTILIPAAVLAWGPQRTTFTMQHPATYVTFNSITDNPTYGDERNFMRAKEKTADNGTYADDVTLAAGKQYTIMIFYHNNASSSFNASGVGIAHGAYARAEVPAIVKSGSSAQAAAYVGATNANPTNVYDDVTFANKTKADIDLHYVPGSTVIHSFGAIDNKVMGDTILSGTGVPLGYNNLDGNLPGCNDYAGYITFQVQADQPSFTFKKDVKISGTKGWKDSVNAAPGTKVDYLLSYENTGTTVQKNVTFKDELPKGETYIKGSSKLTAGSDPVKSVGDGISTTGLNIGDYSPGSTAYLVFSATVQGTPCTTLTNTAAVETKSGFLKDTAGVTVTGSCELPTTGPVEIISGLMGVAAITLGVVYYFRSKRDLDGTLLHAQSHPHPHTSGGGTPPTLTDIADSIKTDHKKK